MTDKLSSSVVRVWDIPTRVFHWSLVLLICVSLYTGLSGGFVEMDYHMLSGYSILSLILFRILWGIFGGYHVRYSNFIRSPTVTLQYLRAIRTEQGTEPGHNPLGALSIIAMLILLLVQAGTGLFANDDIMLEGPLVHLISHHTSRYLTAIHKTNIWLIVGLIGLHVLAILFHQFYKKEAIIRAMFTGKKIVNKHSSIQPPSLSYELLLALAIMIFCALVVYTLISYL